MRHLDSTSPHRPRSPRRPVTESTRLGVAALTLAFLACHSRPSDTTSAASGGRGGAPGQGGASSSSGGQGGAASGPAGSTGAGGTSSSSAASTGSSGTGGGPSGVALFEAKNPWNTPVENDPPSTSSKAVIGWLASNGGFGLGKVQIDFSIHVLEADEATPKLAFTKTGDFFSPDCDFVPFPVPKGGALEGETGYPCASDGDCHLIVVHRGEKKLYEMWRANFVDGTFFGGCAAVWDLAKSYPPSLRGEQCTSADAGGFPIASMVFSADEVFAGSIDHAVRFILPNARIRKGVYARPATHATEACQGGPDAPPYGVRFRLRKDFPLGALPSDGARVVAKALQKYGMILSDGGNVALTATNDTYTVHKWTEVGVDAHSLGALDVEDFEVVGLDATIPYTADCVRNP